VHAEYRDGLYGEALLKLADRMFGETRDYTLVGGLANWIAAASGARILQFDEAEEKRDEAFLASMDDMEKSKCRTAAVLEKLLDVNAVEEGVSYAHSGRGTGAPDALALLGIGSSSSSIGPEHRGSLLAHEPARTFLMRAELLPANFRRILHATEGHKPYSPASTLKPNSDSEMWRRSNSFGPDTGDKWRRLEPLLSLLLDKDEEIQAADTRKKSIPFLPDMPHVLQQRSSSSGMSGHTYRGMQTTGKPRINSPITSPRSPTKKATVVSTTPTVNNPWPAGVYVHLRELFLMYFVHFAPSQSKRSVPMFPLANPAAVPGAGVTSPTSSGSITGARARQSILLAGGMDLPLLFRSSGQISGIHCYFDCVYQYVNYLLPMHVSTLPIQSINGTYGRKHVNCLQATFPKRHESSVFLAAIQSYWLLHNPPSVDPLGVPPSNVPPMGVLLGLPSETASNIYNNTSPMHATDTFAKLGITGGLSMKSKVVDVPISTNAWARTPATSASIEYVVPSTDLLPALTLLLLLQTCDKFYPDIVAGRTVPECGYVDAVVLAQEVAEAFQPRNRNAGEINTNTYSELKKLFPGPMATGARQTARPRLPTSLPGPTCIPRPWADLQFGLFTFLRIHLKKLNPAAYPDLYAQVVDVWLTVLTPWRARNRHRGDQRVPGQEQRVFRYGDSAAALATHAVHEDAGPFSPHVTPATNRRIASFRDHSAHGVVDPAVISQAIRHDSSFEAALARTHDFASQLVWHPQFDDWKHYITMHYAFYTCLLKIFLKAVSKVNFAASPPFSVLQALERVCDVYEPCVVDHLQTVGDVASSMFGASASSSMRSGSKTDLVRVLLLAHLHTLDHPVHVPPTAVLVSVADAVAELPSVIMNLRVQCNATPEPYVHPELSAALTPLLPAMPTGPTLQQRISDSANAAASSISHLWNRIPWVVCRNVGFAVGRTLFWLFSILASLAADILYAVLQQCSCAREHGPDWLNQAASGTSRDSLTLVYDSVGREFPSPDRLQFLIDRLVIHFTRPISTITFSQPRQLVIAGSRSRRERTGCDCSLDSVTAYIKSIIIGVFCWATGLSHEDARTTGRDIKSYGIERDHAGLLTPAAKAKLLSGTARMDASSSLHVLPRSALPAGPFEFQWLVDATHNISSNLLPYIRMIPGLGNVGHVTQLRQSRLDLTRHEELATSQLANDLMRALETPDNVLRMFADWRVLCLFLLLLLLVHGYLLAWNVPALVLCYALEGLTLSLLAQ
jgi:hypothetical protein